MIQYETDPSPFFAANKKYCETVEAKLKTLNADCTGFCNCYGYGIETTLEKDGMKYHLKFSKRQSTQNGVVVPVNALDDIETDLTVVGLNKKFTMIIGRSSLRRIFTPGKFRSILPAPYFMTLSYSPDDTFIKSLATSIQENRIFSLRLNNGTLAVKMNASPEDPVSLITGIEKMVAGWKQL
jgi:hypothetical protein